MGRRQPKRRAGNMVFSAMAGIFILAIVCGVGFSVASADFSDDDARANALGFGSAMQGTSTLSTKSASREPELHTAYYEQSILTSTTQRSIDSGLQMIDDREEKQRRQAEARAREARERAEADNAAAIERVKAEMAKQSDGGQYEYDLPAVDWSVGKADFVAEWSARIDAYLDNSPLAGYGKVFAEAAWENGVDPRWSPAISNTESSKGAVCFLPCNAWGWGSSSWGDWESAIRAHVAGLAEVYGYSITPAAAETYCPPNSSFWYANTVSQMASI